MLNQCDYRVPDAKKVGVAWPDGEGCSPVGQPLCGRPCAPSGVRSIKSIYLPRSTRWPSMSWMRMLSGKFALLCSWTRMLTAGLFASSFASNGGGVQRSWEEAGLSLCMD